MPSIMCFGSKKEEDPDAVKNREIDKQLREDQKKMAKEVKLLLLGMLISCQRDHPRVKWMGEHVLTSE